MIVREVICPRCREQVAPGAPWCAHCGWDMVLHNQLEIQKRLEGESEPLLSVSLDALLVGGILASVFAVGEVVLFAASWKVGLGVWIAVLVIAFFALSEQIAPGPAATRARGYEPLPSRYATVLYRQHNWAPSSPVRGLLILVPLFIAIAGIAILERQIPV